MKVIKTIFILGILAILTIIFSLSNVVAVSCGDTITTDTTLTGDVGPCSGDGLIIGADSVTLDCAGHSITGSGAGYGISSGNSGDTIKNCVIDNFFAGIVAESDDNIIEFNNISNIETTGIDSWGSTNNIIRNNRITDGNNELDAGTAISVKAGKNIVVSGNYIRNFSKPSYGAIDYGDDVTITDNIILDSPNRAIIGWSTRRAKIINNTIINTAGAGNAIQIGYSYPSSDALVINNTIINATGYGIVGSFDGYCDHANTIISGNIIDRTGNFAIMTPAINVTISNNRISNAGYNTGAIYISNPTYSPGETIARDNVISGNTINNGGRYNIYFRGKNNKITENTISNSSNPNSYGIFIQDINAQNNTISNNKMSFLGGGINIASINNSIITGNIISNVGRGIRIYFCNNNVISGNTFSNVTLYYGIAEYFGSNNRIDSNIVDTVTDTIGMYGGIYVASSLSDTITKNKVSNCNKNGITVQSSTVQDISFNEAYYNSENGIYLLDSNVNGVTNNRANYNKIGIHQRNSNSNNVKGNNVRANTQIGIFVDPSNYNTLENNTAEENPTGIYILNSTGNIITANIIKNNTEPLIITNSPYTTITNNLILQNQNQRILIDEASNATSTQSGNIFSFDADADGITDDVDACPNSVHDPATSPIAQSYSWKGGTYFKTVDPKTKQIIDSSYSIASTSGCTCAQIVNLKPGQDKGQLKTGCTKGTMDNFIKSRGWAPTGSVIDLLRSDYFTGTALLAIAVVLLLIYLEVKKIEKAKRKR